MNNQISSHIIDSFLASLFGLESSQFSLKTLSIQMLAIILNQKGETVTILIQFIDLHIANRQNEPMIEWVSLIIQFDDRNILLLNHRLGNFHDSFVHECISNDNSAINGGKLQV